MRIVKTLVIGVLLIVIVGLGGMLAVPGRLDAESNAINFPIYRNTVTVTAIREMITELGWEKEAETGDGKTLVITATDYNKTVVTFNYKRILARGTVSVVTESGAEYSAGKLITEIARRTGILAGRSPLKAEKQVAASAKTPVVALAKIPTVEKEIPVVTEEKTLELIKKTVTTYITAGLSKDCEALTNVCAAGSAVLKQACTDLHKVKGLANIELVEAHANKEAALAISSGVTTLRARKGVLVFTLKQVEGTWVINDVDFVSPTAAEDKLVWFILRNQHAETLIKVAGK
jgi:hypothetical protein